MLDFYKDLQDSDYYKLPSELVESVRGTEQWGFGDLSKITYLRTYSRQKDDGSFEDWTDTCVRLVEGAATNLRYQLRKRRTYTAALWSHLEKKFHRMFLSHHARKWSAPGRGLWFMGTKALFEKGAAAANNCGFVSTTNMHLDPAAPFCDVMDFSMCGVGMGWDTLGAKRNVKVVSEVRDSGVFVIEDTREGWVDAVNVLLRGFMVTGLVPSHFDFSKIRKRGSKLRLMGGTASGPEPLMRVLGMLSKMYTARLGQNVDEELIADTMNIIGLCSTAAGDRRPAQIGLGSIDSTLHKLKDDSTLRPLLSRKYEIIGEAKAKRPKLAELMTSLSEEHKCSDAGSQDRRYALAQNIAEIEREMEQELQQNAEYVQIQDEINAHPLNTHRFMSNNSNTLFDGDIMPEEHIDKTVMNGEPSAFWLDNARTYGRFVDGKTYCDMFVAGTNPCVEQSLEDGELCCLVETFITAHLVDGRISDDWYNTLEDAFLYAKIVTGIPTHKTKTNKIIETNRRIGTSIAGLWEFYESVGPVVMSKVLDSSYCHLKNFDTEISETFGVPQSIKITSIKPGGTTPLVAGYEGGLNQPKFRYGFRSIRISNDNKLLPWLEARGYRIENALREPDTKVVYFPVHNKNDKVRLSTEVSLKEKADVVAIVQRYWADNSVSCTLEFQPHEQQDVRDIIKTGHERFKAIAFLPQYGMVYEQAPYSECTQEQYEYAVSLLRDVPFGPGFSHDQQERGCDGGVCSIDKTAN